MDASTLAVGLQVMVYGFMLGVLMLFAFALLMGTVGYIRRLLG